MMSEARPVPRLRFPEFKDAGDWDETSIGQLGDVVTGSTPSTARPAYYGGDRMFVSPADISDRRFIEKTKTTLTTIGFKETRPIKANSILFVCIGSIGKIAQNQHECATNQQINSVVPNSNNVAGFVYYALSGMADNIANMAGRQVIPIVNKSLFSSVKLLVPKMPEQQKIAACLTSIDDLITAEAQNLDALKTHKKGLMQQLFPCEGEVIPRLRFPEFKDAGDWEEKQLGDGDVSIFVSDRMPREELRLENYVSTVNLLPDFTGVTAATKLPPTGGATKFAIDDILISNIRPYLKKICLSLQDGSASNDVIVVRAKECVSSQFLSFLLMNDRFVDYVMVGARGVKMPRGDISQMKEYPLTIPKPSEQQKIAECLTSIDDLITAKAQKLDALKTHKKGLMQQLFPTSDEVKV